MHVPRALVSIWTRCIGGIGLVSFLVMAPVAQAASQGNIAAGKAKAAACAGCHGLDGNGVGNPDWPKLAGQLPEYLFKQLKDFKSGERRDLVMNGTMNGMVAALSEQDMKDLAAYYASQRIKLGVARDEELARLGERIYRGGIAKRGVSACMSCHGPSGHGIPPHFPRTSAQFAEYSEKQLLAFKSAKRPSYNDIMTRIAFRMSEKEIKAVAEYMAGLH